MESIERQTAGRSAKAATGTSPTAYQPLSTKVVVGLSAAGGVLTTMGALGPWIRATVLVSEREAPKQVALLMGNGSLVGWGLAALGALSIVGSLAWLMRPLLPKIIPVLTALVIAGLSWWRLALLDERIGRMIDLAARRARVSDDVGVSTFHAGFGWGAWFLMLASVVTILGVISGIMRELDLRRRSIS